MSTIRTIAIASGVVTRRPPRNSRLDAEPVQVLGDLRAAAVHDDRPQPGVAQEHDVLGEGACSSGLVIALPPYLITTILPWKRCQPRQRVDEDGRLLQRLFLVAAHVEYAEFSST